MFVSTQLAGFISDDAPMVIIVFKSEGHTDYVTALTSDRVGLQVNRQLYLMQ